MRRKRQNRGTWFPVLGSLVGGSESEYLTTMDRQAFSVSTDPGFANIVANPLIPDETPDVESAGVATTLRDFVEGQTCIIHRIVGKIVWGVGQSQNAGYSPNVIVCASGIAVLPVADDTNIPDLPSDEYDPLRPQNSSQPWLWRRTWILANNAQVNVASAVGFNHPASNEFFASRDDGPHIDTKGTKRAIRREQRIFLVHNVMNADINADEGTAGYAAVWTDVRVFGQMVRSRNKSTFK